MDPYWMYRVKNGAVESKLFTSKKEPKGWLDSNKAAKYELANGKPMPTKAEEAAKEAEQAELNRIAAEDKAKSDAEAAAEQEKLEREKQEAIDSAVQAERDKIAAEERTKIEAELAETNRIAAEVQAKKDAEAAELTEEVQNDDSSRDNQSLS